MSSKLGLKFLQPTSLAFLQSHLGPLSQGLCGSTQFIAPEKSTTVLVLMTPDPEHILWSGCSAVLWRARSAEPTPSLLSDWLPPLRGCLWLGLRRERPSETRKAPMPHASNSGPLPSDSTVPLETGLSGCSMSWSENSSPPLPPGEYRGSEESTACS
ncbi:hypothetical protein EYF80_001484 [Liparis tanakae]|uniref:Uncharacterized protein n=1 Tax=Liparis tanakae TaxID=230148 RepID=A0A4Z2JF62_9TELE|nr:hypothetical protein EYF80_001484 [Liparis tanakae]